MSDLGGGDGPDRPRWEGFPGGVDPLDPNAGPVDPNATGPIDGLGGRGYVPPEPPQFPYEQSPYEQPLDETAEIPLIGESPLDPLDPLPPVAAAAGGPGRRRAHAAPKPHTSRYVAFACAGAVLVIGGGLAFAGCNSNDVATTGASGPTDIVVPSSTPAQSLPSNSPVASDSVSPSPSASASTSKSASPSSSASASSSASSSPSASATPVGQKQPVVVLNSTNITGLAKRVAADLRSGGWTVTKTANWTGAKPTKSTIYYLPGAKNKASAELFAKKFSVTSTVKPALPGMTSNLTLVITSDAS